MSNILKTRTETLLQELKSYIEVFTEKAKTVNESAFKGKVDNIELFDEKEIMNTAYDLFGSQTLHHMDIMLMELNFIHTYQNCILTNPKIEFDEETVASYKAIKKKHTSIYILDKDDSFKVLDQKKLDITKENFIKQIEQVGGLDYITDQLEKELKRE